LTVAPRGGVESSMYGSAGPRNQPGGRERQEGFVVRPARPDLCAAGDYDTISSARQGIAHRDRARVESAEREVGIMCKYVARIVTLLPGAWGQDRRARQRRALTRDEHPPRTKIIALRRVATALAAWLLLGQACEASLKRWDIYSDVVIDEVGYVYGSVRIYDTPPEQTTVDMVGGRCDEVQVFDASILNITGGTVQSLYLRDRSSANISGGKLRGVFAWDNTRVDFLGDARATSVGASDWATVNMAGGTVKYLGAGGRGTVNLYGGTVSEAVDTWDLGTVNIYGYDFDYDPGGGDYDGGRLTGFYLDGTAFAIDLDGTETITRMNLVPEPASLLLLSLGALFRRWRTTSSQET